MTWDGICEHGLLLDTYCEECDKPMTAKLEKVREAIKRALARSVVGPKPLRKTTVADWLSDYDLDVATSGILAAIEAAGWQCVPREPTEEMRDAGSPLMREFRWRGGEYAEAAYRAMLAAAPKPGGEE